MLRLQLNRLSKRVLISFEHTTGYSSSVLIVLIVNYYRGITRVTNKAFTSQSLELWNLDPCSKSGGEMYVAFFHPFLSVSALCNYICRGQPCIVNAD